MSSWDLIQKQINESAKHPDPQEFLGIKRQTVQPEDRLERRRRYLLSWTARKAERTRQWSKWQDLSSLIMPELGRFLTSDHNVPKDTSKILNGTPTRMARSLIAMLISGHTSPARPWLNLTVMDQNLAEWGPMRRWLWELNRRVRLLFELANFYRVMAMCVYPGLAVFGLGTCLLEEDPVKVLRFPQLAMGSYVLAGDGDGIIDTLQYEEAWTVGELVKEFGWDNVSNSIKVAWNGGWYEQYVSILRTISPNSEFIPGTIGAKGKKWGSAWMEIGGLSSAAGALAQPSSDPAIGFLREGGYESFPVLCARWATTSRDIYPTGPGHDALPDARMVMQLERRELLAISKGVNPAMLIPDALRLNRLSMLPGDAIYYPTGTNGIEIKPAHIVDPRWVEQSASKRQEAMQRIGQAFFVDLARIFTETQPGDSKQPDTAAAVAAKDQEKMLQLGPVLENINEFLTRLVERTLQIMAKRRMIPPAPLEARDMRLKVEFVSILSQAQKLLGAQPKERLIQMVGQLGAVVGPNALEQPIDKINTDVLVDEYADDLGIPPLAIATDEEVAKKRQARQQQMQQAQQAQMMATGADAAQKAGTVDMKGDNLVTRMLGQTAGAEAGESGEQAA